jgi:hypothetical protein
MLMLLASSFAVYVPHPLPQTRRALNLSPSSWLHSHTSGQRTNSGEQHTHSVAGQQQHTHSNAGQQQHTYSTAGQQQQQALHFWRSHYDCMTMHMKQPVRSCTGTLSIIILDALFHVIMHVMF